MASKITAQEQLDRIREACEHSGPIVVKHWFYRGASAPDHLLFGDFEEFEEYLAKASAGDAIDIWDISSVCTTSNRLAGGKCPDEDGRVPKRGAY